MSFASYGEEEGKGNRSGLLEELNDFLYMAISESS